MNNTTGPIYSTKFNDLTDIATASIIGGTNLWNIATDLQAERGDGSALYFGNAGSWNYSSSNGRVAGIATISAGSMIIPAGGALLSFDSFLETEGYPSQYDKALVQVSTNGGTSWTTVASNAGGNDQVTLLDPTGPADGAQRVEITLDSSYRSDYTVALLV